MCFIEESDGIYTSPDNGHYRWRLQLIAVVSPDHRHVRAAI